MGSMIFVEGGDVPVSSFCCKSKRRSSDLGARSGGGGGGGGGVRGRFSLGLHACTLPNEERPAFSGSL